MSRQPDPEGAQPERGRAQPDHERAQRSDAQRNRGRLLAAAAAVFAEHGLDAGVGEIAACAGVGRGTFFRHFPTKQDLIAAIVHQRIREQIADGRALLEAGSAAEAPFEFIEQFVRSQQSNRALTEAIDDEFLANPLIRSVHAELVEFLDELLDRGKAAGSVREEIGALDVVMLIKGVCAAATALEPTPAMLERHLDLIAAAIGTPAHARPLRGSAPTMSDLEAVVSASQARREPAA